MPHSLGYWRGLPVPKRHTEKRLRHKTRRFYVRIPVSFFAYLVSF